MGLEGQLALPQSPSKGCRTEAGAGGWDALHVPPARPLLWFQTGNNSLTRTVPGESESDGAERMDESQQISASFL